MAYRQRYKFDSAGLNPNAFIVWVLTNSGAVRSLRSTKQFKDLQMKKHHRAPMLGLLGSTLACLLLIHFWLAGWYASLSGISYRTAYGYAITLLVLLQSWRAWMILRDKDDITKLIDRQLKKDPGADASDRDLRQ